MEIIFNFKEKNALAYDGDKVIGRCEFEETENVWNIIHTKVNESYQGQGIAKQLVYNVPISVDTIRRRYPIKWTYQEGVESLIVDTKIWVF